MTLEQSKSEKCDMVSSLILWAMKMLHQQICYHVIPKMLVSNGYVLVKFDIGKSTKNDY